MTAASSPPAIFLDNPAPRFQEGASPFLAAGNVSFDRGSNLMLPQGALRDLRMCEPHIRKLYGAKMDQNASTTANSSCFIKPNQMPASQIAGHMMSAVTVECRPVYRSLAKSYTSTHSLQVGKEFRMSFRVGLNRSS